MQWPFARTTVHPYSGFRVQGSGFGVRDVPTFALEPMSLTLTLLGRWALPDTDSDADGENEADKKV